MIPTDAADRHRTIAAAFTDTARAVADWTGPAPVPGWSAGDVVAHLVDWSTGFLTAGGVTLPDNPATDHASRWDVHAASIQALLDGPQAASEFAHPIAGTHQLGEAIDRFYTTDVFMHTWDLARSAGLDTQLDADEAQRVLDGMVPIEEVLRASGQYGESMPVPDGATPGDRLMAFVGRTLP